MRNRVKTKSKLALLLFCGVAFQARYAFTGEPRPLVEAEVKYQGGVVSLQFRGKDQWIYDVDRTVDGTRQFVEITIDPLTNSSVRILEKFKSPIVKGISVSKGGTDSKFRLKLEIASGEIDSLDYLTESPSRLVVDFYEKDFQAKHTLPEKVKVDAKSGNSSAKIERTPATTDVLTIDPKGSIPAVLASTPVRAGVYDGADPGYERFQVKDYEIKEESIIRSRSNYFIPFPMLEFETSLWSRIKTSAPIYQIQPTETDENKQARLLLALFERKRFLVFQKSRAWFQEKYPNSEYNSIIDFIDADVEMELSKQDSTSKRFGVAIQMYKEAIRKHPKSPLAEKVSLAIAIAAFDHRDHLTALRLFQEHLENKEIEFRGTLSKDLARLGQVQVFDRMKMSAEALKIADELEQNSTDPELRAEASYRRGDVNFRNKNYLQAVEDYQKALKKYPSMAKQFPSAVYNLAEAHFLQQSYKEALATYIDFIKSFPTNDHTAFAMTRTGEIMEIFGVDQARVVGAFLETYFRYGENPKAIVARIRLLSARMKSMKAKEVEPATKEILELSKKLDWPQIESFATIMVADGYSKRGEFEKSIDLLTQYYQKNPMAPNLSLYQTRLVSNINDLMRTALLEGKFMSTLQTHQKYADSWLKGSERLDTDYYLGRAYEKGGAYSDAERYYKRTVNKLYSLQGTAKGKELLVLQNMPSDQVINLRLAAVEFEQQQWSEAYDYIKTIKRPLEMGEEDQVERVILLSELLDKRGDLDSASRFLSELLRAWKGQPELVAKPYLQLAEIEFKQGQRAQAIQSLEKIRILENDSGKVPSQYLRQALHRLGDIYLEDKNDMKAIEVLEQYLERFEEQQPLASQRFRLGLIFFQRGEVQKAAEAWANFKGERASFWHNLAQEKLKDSKWKDGYKKYIDRIPAMAGVDNQKGGKQ
jgi:tetratricopeptide (TPR) repeat protein